MLSRQSLVYCRLIGRSPRQHGSPSSLDEPAHALHMLIVSGGKSVLILMVVFSTNVLSCRTGIHKEVQSDCRGRSLIVVDPAVQHPLLAGLAALLLLLSCWWAAWCWEAWGLCTPRAGEGSRMGSAAFIIACSTARVSTQIVSYGRSSKQCK